MVGSRIRRRAAVGVRIASVLALAVAVLIGLPGLGGVPDARGDEERFIAAVADLPLPPELTEVEGAGLVFDKPEGRIIEAYARGAVDREKVARFYHATLPQLGWQRLDRLVFAREGEVLRIDFSGPDGDLTVRFSISPQ